MNIQRCDAYRPAGMLLAGGEGIRLRPLTNNIPKCMLKIDEKPVLEHNLNIFKKANITDIRINLYYKKDAIIDYFDDGSYFGVNITYFHQGGLLGTAGDAKRMGSMLRTSFVVIYADNFSNCNIKHLLEWHKRMDGIATVALFDKRKNPNSGIAGGWVSIDTESSKLLEFREGETAATYYINAGIYILEPEILKYIPENTFYDFGKDLFPLLLSEGVKIYGYIMPEDEYLFGIDTMDCYEKTKRFYEERLKGAL